ncbi:sodium- and chloride-dependent glycine transporter 1-like [Octopus sinensis]|uniref:Transporter n=1 Tax=Octopus sinensis TaxID=2607531 RepID=A0A6P7SS29_9MOLL|nr:sodium- and chloride-dependent glycine transporter 1-like [Octopus sinensis]
MGRQRLLLKISENESVATKNPTEEERGTWGNQIEFFFTCLGYAVGLGNVWRFPYLCYRNGGGAFLLPYIISLIFLGIPYVFLEISFGQFAGRGPLSIWKASPAFKGIGYSMITIGAILAIYYNVILAYSFHFFFASLRKNLLWANCLNPWNTCNCFSETQNAMLKSFTDTLAGPNFTDFRSFLDEKHSHCYKNASELYGNVIGSWTGNITDLKQTLNMTNLKSPSEEYFYTRVLSMSSGVHHYGTIQWELALCLLLSWMVIFFVLIRGIKSLGKVVYFTSVFPYVLLTALIINGSTLSGAVDGIMYYLKPNAKRLLDVHVWKDAVVQIFFSLCTCTGGLVAMSSYNRFHNNSLRDAILVPIINCLTSIYAGIAIFMVIGHMAHVKGASVEDVITEGPGLVFVVYPEGLSQIVAAPVWSALFFLMMLCLGFSTMFSGSEMIFTALIDDYADHLRKKKASTLFRLFMCTIFFLIGLCMLTNGGHYMLNLFDTYLGGFPLLVIGVVEGFVISWVYGIKRFSEDIEMMLGRKPFMVFKICWSFIGPCSILVVIIISAIYQKGLTLGDYVYPDWANGIGWAIVGICITSIPAYFFYYLFKSPLFIESVKAIITPAADWGPSPDAAISRKAKVIDPSTVRQNNLQGVQNEAFSNL